MSNEQVGDFAFSVNAICQELNAPLASGKLSDSQARFDSCFVAIHGDGIEPITPSRIFQVVDSQPLRVEDLALLFGIPKESREPLNSTESIISTLKTGDRIQSIWDSIDKLPDAERRVLLLWSTRNEIARIQNNIDFNSYVGKTQTPERTFKRLSQLGKIQEKLLAPATTPNPPLQNA